MLELLEISRDLIESVASQEQLMCLYTGVVPKTRKLFNSPFRKESRSSCSFYTSKSGILYLKDFGTGVSYSWVNVVMEKYGCSYYKALKIVAQDLGLVQTNVSKKKVKLKYIEPLQKEPTSLAAQIKPYTKEELKYWKQYKIGKKQLELFKVFSIQTVFINGEPKAKSTISNPIFGYFFGEQNQIELWKFYSPLTTNKSYKFLNNAPSNYIQGWEQLPSAGDIVVITKSMKDVMCLHSFNIPACAPNSESLFLVEEQVDELSIRFNKIIVLYDNDLPGIQAMKRIKKQYPNLIYTWLPRHSAKDFSDYYKIFKLNRTRILINYFKDEINRKYRTNF